MRFGKVFICTITALFLALAAFVGLKETESDHSFTAQIAGQERIVSWQTYDGNAYLFLPGYAELSQVTLHVSREGLYTIGDIPVTDGMNADVFQIGQTYSLDTAPNVETDAETFTFVRSGGVATLFADVRSGSMDRIHGDKEETEAGFVRLYLPDGSLSHSADLLSLSGRGNSTWNRDKKSYNMELRLEADLLGMGEAKKWILLSNAMDPTHLRNKIVYDFAADAGLAFSPDGRWVDLYLNGEYAGLYLLSERNEVHENRVNLAENGSFLVSKDWEWRFEEAGNPYILTDAGAALRIYHAGMEEEMLKSIWQSAENAILAADGVDPVTGKHWTH